MAFSRFGKVSLRKPRFLFSAASRVPQRPPPPLPASSGVAMAKAELLDEAKKLVGQKIEFRHKAVIEGIPFDDLYTLTVEDTSSEPWDTKATDPKNLPGLGRRMRNLRSIAEGLPECDQAVTWLNLWDKISDLGVPCATTREEEDIVGESPKQTWRICSGRVLKGEQGDAPWWDLRLTATKT